jgi:hypothetical protein
MGARINFVFQENIDGPSVVLYSHWGQDYWQVDIANALQHSKPRWSDSSYFTRMMISNLIKDSVLDETGFGIYSVSGTNFDLGEQTVVIDMINQTVRDGEVSANWNNFMQAYATKVYAEQSAM